MNNIFLVTSALHSPYGLIAGPDRLTQTIATALSIRQRVKNVKIYLIEGGVAPLDIKLRTELKLYYDDILDFTQHNIIQFAHKQQNDAGGLHVKAPCESFLLRKACELFNTSADDRIFKISGRYSLSDKFDITQHHQAIGKYVFLNRLKPSIFEYAETKQQHTWTEFQYSTRLYSFCGSMLNQAITDYQRIFDKLIEFYSSGNFIDLENSTYMLLNKDLITEIPIIGVVGTFAAEPTTKLDE